MNCASDDVLVRVVRAITDYPSLVENMIQAFPQIEPAVRPLVRKVVSVENCRAIKFSGSIKYTESKLGFRASAPALHYAQGRYCEPQHIAKAIRLHRVVSAPTQVDAVEFKTEFTLRGYRWGNLREIELDGVAYAVWDRKGHARLQAKPVAWYHNKPVCKCTHHALADACPQCASFSRDVWARMSAKLGGPACMVGAMCRCHHVGAHSDAVHHLFLEKYPELEDIKDRTHSTQSFKSNTFATVLPKIVPAIRSMRLVCCIPAYFDIPYRRLMLKNTPIPASQVGW